MPLQIVRKQWTVDEYEAMGRSGILREDDRLELIEGEIVQMPPIGPRHASSVDRTNYVLVSLMGNRAIVRVQNPIRLDQYSEPQPDFALLRPRDDFYNNRHPEPADILLVIEISDTTLDYDRSVKLALYAKAGIPEVWIVNVADRLVHVHRDLQALQYRNIRTYHEGETISPAVFDDLSIPVSAFLS